MVVRRVTSLRRKRYTPEELARIDVQWKGFVRKCKLRRNYATDLIIYMVEVPLYMDMFTGFTMAFQGDEQVEGNYTNSDKHRFTGVCAVSATGKKLPMSAIFRLLKSSNCFTMCIVFKELLYIVSMNLFGTITSRKYDLEKLLAPR